MTRARSYAVACAVTLVLPLPSRVAAAANNASADSSLLLANRLFERLSGVPLAVDDPRLVEMAHLIKTGQAPAAAKIAMQDDGFYDVTLKSWAIAMATKSESPLTPLNDFAAMMIGVTRDDLDARTLLTGDFTYIGSGPLDLPPPSDNDNLHYLAMEEAQMPLKSTLVRQEPQRKGFPEAAGVLTSRGWAEAHMLDGTNRRALQYTFQEFLCAPITSWKDARLSDVRVRRDVTRAPGNDPGTYDSVCRACHAPMDAMGGAYARFDFVGDKLTYAGSSRVAAKMNRNAGNYPEGWEVIDDSWLNLLPQSATQTDFGWTGPTSGRGLRSFGSMIAHASAFGRCMTQRVFSQLCRRDPVAGDQAALATAAQAFADSNYKFKDLFAEVAVLPACLGEMPVPSLR